MAKTASASLSRELLRAQRNEITEHQIYSRLTAIEKDRKNARMAALEV